MADVTTPPEPYPTDVTTSASWRSAMSRSAPKPFPCPHFERALEKLTGKAHKVEVHDDLGVVISRLPQEDPLTTAGRIEGALLTLLEER